MSGKMFLMPPRPGHCPICAVEHEPEQPHNRDSLYYQVRFQIEHGRTPTWEDAMAHCPPDTKKFWAKALSNRGVEVGTQTEG